jgi:CTP synthase (UTP-ammonia lyase)
MVCIGAIGDYEPTNETHLATTAAVQHAGTQRGVSTQVTWVPTDRVEGDAEEILASFDGLIIAPGSPYRSLGGALTAIEYARVHDVALLGTCGGFQHVVLEFARNVVGFEDAQHAEYDPYASTLFITPLSCSLAGQTMTVHIKEGTQAVSAYQRSTVTERYYCNFGLNPAYLNTIERAGLTVSGTDQAGEPRILELPAHHFFVATLFVPQTSSTPTCPHPLLEAFVEAAVDGRAPVP